MKSLKYCSKVVLTKQFSGVIWIRKFTDKELEVLIELADDKGHALWDLEARTGIAKGNLKLKVDSLMKKRIIYRGAARKTRNRSSSHPNDIEYPYYIIPQRFFWIRKELQNAISDTQSKLKRKYKKDQLSQVDKEKMGKLREKLNLYRKFLSKFETRIKTLRIIPPKDRIMGNYDKEKLEEPKVVLGALGQWSPSQAEIYRIAGEIEEDCTSFDAAVNVVIKIKPELYIAHDKWIKDHLPLLPKELLEMDPEESLEEN